RPSRREAMRLPVVRNRSCAHLANRDRLWTKLRAHIRRFRALRDREPTGVSHANADHVEDDEPDDESEEHGEPAIELLVEDELRGDRRAIRWQRAGGEPGGKIVRTGEEADARIGTEDL